MKRAKIQMILAMVIFGTIGILRRYIPYSSGLMAFVRGLVGTLFLLLVMVMQRGETIPKDFLKANIWKLIASGILIGGNWILLFEAYNYTSVAAATISYYMAPVFVMMVAPFLFKESFNRAKVLGIIMAFIGMVLVSGVLETGLVGLQGIAYGLGAAAMYASVILINKTIRDLSANDRTLIQLGVATLVLLPYILVTENFAVLEWDTLGVILLIVAGVVHTGFAYAMYFGAIPQLEAQTVALLSYIDPIVAVILSQVILGESLSWSAWLGVFLVIGATLIGDLKVFSRRAEG